MKLAKILLLLIVLNMNCASNDKYNNIPPAKEGYLWSFKGDIPPSPIINIDVRKYYPEKARIANIKNYKVIVLCCIDEFGVLQDYKIATDDEEYGFNEAAIKVLKSIKYSPGQKDNIPVKMAHYIPITFVLNE
jgi:periplasmic protein TonB